MGVGAGVVCRAHLHPLTAWIVLAFLCVRVWVGGRAEAMTRPQVQVAQSKALLHGACLCVSGGGYHHTVWVVVGGRVWVVGWNGRWQVVCVCVCV